jgi:hypothetical protein
MTLESAIMASSVSSSELGLPSSQTPNEGSTGGGMDELLPLVLQLINPDQVRFCRHHYQHVTRRISNGSTFRF